MRRVSPKRQARNRATSQPRKDFLLEMDFRCCVCGTRNASTVHEIARGSGIRDAALSERCAWLCACWLCNSGCLNDYGRWSLVEQLALKLLTDAEHFDLERINVLRGREPGAITREEVDGVLELVRERIGV